jgi:hypothetical protein
MKNSAHFAYVQARLQSRHGARPKALEWRRLHSIGDLGNYLQVAQRGSLSDWVVGMNVNTHAHEIELTLRQRFRTYIDELSHWLGSDWQPAVVWVKRLVDLPVLNHLLTGLPVNNWMLDDPELKPFVHVNENQRTEAFIHSECKVFFYAHQNKQPLPDAWYLEFQKRCPLDISNDPGLLRLWKAVARRLQAQCDMPDENTALARESLEDELNASFRRFSGTPAALFIHLGLIALDLEKLRGGLVHRSLFPEYQGEQL